MDGEKLLPGALSSVWYANERLDQNVLRVRDDCGHEGITAQRTVHHAHAHAGRGIAAESWAPDRVLNPRRATVEYGV